MHTIIPALAMRNGRCEMPFGVMGADYQPMGHTHVITNMVDYGMDVQAAIDAPRMFYEGENTEVERGVPAATVAGLKARGHDVVLRPAPWGGGQAIVIDWERGHADRRLRSAQGRLRAGILGARAERRACTRPAWSSTGKPQSPPRARRAGARGSAAPASGWRSVAPERRRGMARRRAGRARSAPAASTAIEGAAFGFGRFRFARLGCDRAAWSGGDSTALPTPTIRMAASCLETGQCARFQT